MVELVAKCTECPIVRGPPTKAPVNVTSVPFYPSQEEVATIPLVAGQSGEQLD